MAENDALQPLTPRVVDLNELVKEPAQEREITPQEEELVYMRMLLIAVMLRNGEGRMVLTAEDLTAARETDVRVDKHPLLHGGLVVTVPEAEGYNDKEGEADGREPQGQAGQVRSEAQEGSEVGGE